MQAKVNKANGSDEISAEIIKLINVCYMERQPGRWNKIFFNEIILLCTPIVAWTNP